MRTIFVHGLGQTSACWQSTLSYLPKHIVSTCPNLFELCPRDTMSYEKLYATFVAYCEKFAQPINLCGISLGAILALNYTIDYPKRVKSLVFIAGQFKMPKILLLSQKILFHMLPNKYFHKSGLDKQVMIRLSSSMMELDFSKELTQISCPVLAVCGTKDWVNQKTARTLTDHLKNARYQFIDGVGHEVNQQAPQSLAEIITVFYKEIV